MITILGGIIILVSKPNERKRHSRNGETITKRKKLPPELSVQTGVFTLSKYYRGIKVSIKSVSMTNSRHLKRSHINGFERLLTHSHSTVAGGLPVMS